MDRQRDITFFSLASSSEGNCFYLGTAAGGVLVDAGIGVRKILATLCQYNIPLQSIKGLFVTHDHSDHTRAVCSLAERYGIPVYATAPVVEGINATTQTKYRLCSCVTCLTKEQSVTVGDFTVTAFDLPHDASDCVGYSFEAFDKRFTLMTDLGHITAVARQYIAASNYLVIESNYDRQMLAANPTYPYILKQRIDSNYGHLCNEQTAEVLAELCHPQLKRIWLCHISRDNNTPQMALETVCQALQGRDVIVQALERTNPSPLLLL